MQTKRPEDPGASDILYLILYMDSTAIKIGRVTSERMLERRIKEFRTLDPNIEIVKTWTIRRNWESHLRHFATRGIEGISHMRAPGTAHSEVFRFTAMVKDRDTVIQSIVERIDDWVGLYSKHFPPEPMKKAPARRRKATS